MKTCQENKVILHSNVTVGENGHLYFAGYDTVELAREYGIPVEVLSAFTAEPGTIVGDLE